MESMVSLVQPCRELLETIEYGPAEPIPVPVSAPAGDRRSRRLFELPRILAAEPGGTRKAVHVVRP